MIWLRRHVVHLFIMSLVQNSLRRFISTACYDYFWELAAYFRTSILASGFKVDRRVRRGFVLKAEMRCGPAKRISLVSNQMLNKCVTLIKRWFNRLHSFPGLFPYPCRWRGGSEFELPSSYVWIDFIFELCLVHHYFILECTYVTRWPVFHWPAAASSLEGLFKIECLVQFCASHQRQRNVRKSLS